MILYGLEEYEYAMQFDEYVDKNTFPEFKLMLLKCLYHPPSYYKKKLDRCLDIIQIAMIRQMRGLLLAGLDLKETLLPSFVKENIG